ncbi:unnamed protein product [Zymoseptoria tritici ST99CH_1A5]|uniref:Zn(2)-C6 fungal-type domain-containing protein n=1 Tax=Zymoseptoria tritici ST99CH_1A5 TaxID=1276529 RepID=A0A1Y6L3M2_ZYMTR|nr:unnamed protein product [Zymoseptoria tritici ST99CH_1A5]
MSAAGRPLLAARLSDEASTNGASPPPTRQAGSRAKRTLIESACSACRRRKSRCDGVRPACSRCQNLRTECQYEAEEGESRWSALRRRNQVLEAERDQVRELLSYVQTRPEQEAMEIFQRMRQSNYDDIFILLRHLKDSAMGMAPGGMGQILPPGSSAGVERLPPIQAILDVPGRNMTPTHLTQSHSMSSEDSRSSSVPDLTGGMPSQRSHHYDTLEPTLYPNHPSQQQHHPQILQQHQQQHHNGMPPPISYSSEESSASLNSTSMDMAQQKPYYHHAGSLLPRRIEM